jgi:tungstate transport system substrate-binding protein
MKKVAAVCVLVAGAWLSWSWIRGGDEPRREVRVVRVATTTSVVDSGLMAKLVPLYQKRHDVRVEVASVGSGEALARLARGEADVAITHAPDEELELAQAGRARRTVVWRNDFVVVGPPDAASIVAGAGDVADALARIARSERPFVSRADDSGTHRRERTLFARAGVVPRRRVEAHAGMAATLARTAQLGGFTLSDKATFLARKKSLDLVILYQDDDALANEYAVMERDDASWSTFLGSEDARAIVGAHGVREHAEPLFTPSPRP